MPSVKLTPASVKGLPVPAHGQVDYWDTLTTGFGLRVSEGGRKTFVVSYRHLGRFRRLTLGSVTELSLADARECARQARASATRGDDPATTKQERRRMETFQDLAADYLALHATRKKKSWKADEYTINGELLPAWRHRGIGDIRRRDVRELLECIADPQGRNAPVRANRVFALVRKMFRFALQRDLLEHSPCEGIERPGQERARDRVLTDEELVHFWRGLDDRHVISEPLAVMFRLRLLTAQRPGEVARMRWTDIDRKDRIWILPATETKNGVAHRVPMSRQASGILENFRTWTKKRLAVVNAGRARKRLVPKEPSVWVFPSPRGLGDRPLGDTKKPMRRARQDADFQARDLRRTAASKMTSLGVPRLVVKRILNHIEDDITGVYDRYSYDREKREALVTWGNRVEALVKKGVRKPDRAA